MGLGWEDVDIPARMGGGRFRVVRVAGDGGLSRVFEAEDEVMGARRALKVLHPAYRERHWAQHRLRNEARVMGVLHHPSIVRIFDLYDEPGLGGVLVLEYLPRGTLVQQLNDVGVERARATGGMWRHARPILEAMVAVHDAGVVHRDLKPGNVFMDESDRVRLGDFGLALAADPGRITRLTATGQGLGTPRFSAPEQKLDAASVRPAADVYSLGATLLTLAGVVPPADLAVRAEDARDEMWTSAPGPIGPFLRRACRFSAASRYPDAAAMLRAYDDAELSSVAFDG